MRYPYPAEVSTCKRLRRLAAFADCSAQHTGLESRAMAYRRTTGPFRLPLRERSPMSDKSPRQHMSKKLGKSIKEKRAEKRSKASVETFSDKIHPTKKK
jgi:hypothetical protein